MLTTSMKLIHSTPMAASSVIWPFCQRSNNVTAINSVPGPTSKSGSATDCTVSRKMKSQQQLNRATVSQHMTHLVPQRARETPQYDTHVPLYGARPINFVRHIYFN